MRAFLPEYDLRVSKSLGEAVELLASGQGWRPIAGGTDLMVLLNAGKLPCQPLLSIRSIAELKSINVQDEFVSIGAAVTFRELREHPLLQTEFPLLCQSASWTGGIANQNQATLGGNIVNASPAADSCPPLLVHDATLRFISAAGQRTLPYADFHLGYKKLAMSSDELLYRIELPRRDAEWGYFGRKVGTRRAQAISKCCVALALKWKSEHIEDVRLALGSVAPIPLRCRRTEDALRGHTASTPLIQRACEALRTEITPIDDIRSTAEYRTRVVENLLRSFLTNRDDTRRIQ